MCGGWNQKKVGSCTNTSSELLIPTVLHYHVAATVDLFVCHNEQANKSKL